MSLHLNIKRVIREEVIWPATKMAFCEISNEDKSYEGYVLPEEVKLVEHLKSLNLSEKDLKELANRISIFGDARYSEGYSTGEISNEW